MFSKGSSYSANSQTSGTVYHCILATEGLSRSEGQHSFTPMLVLFLSLSGTFGYKFVTNNEIEKFSTISQIPFIRSCNPLNIMNIIIRNCSLHRYINSQLVIEGDSVHSMHAFWAEVGHSLREGMVFWAKDWLCVLGTRLFHGYATLDEFLKGQRKLSMGNLLVSLQRLAFSVYWPQGFMPAKCRQ